MLHQRRRKIYFDWIKDIGAYALFEKPLAIVNRFTRHRVANERIGDSLLNCINN